MRIIFHSSGTRAGIALAVLFIALSFGTLHARPSPHSHKKGASAQTFLCQMNTVSNAEFFYTNRGVLFNAGYGQAEGLFWPRGSGNSYIFGEGLWFATKKKMPANSAEVKDGWSLAGAIGEQAANCLIANSVSRRLFAADGGTSLYVRQDTDPAFHILTTFGSNVTALAQLPNGELLIGTNNRGLFVGPETGPWHATSIPTQVVGISSFGVVCTGITLGNDSIYTPNSDGSSWTSRSKMAVFNKLYLSSLPNNGTILANIPPFLLLSLDTGETWDTIPRPLNITGASLVSDGSIVVSTQVGVWQSTDRGAHWVALDTNLTDLNVRFIRSDDGRNFVIENDSGVYTNTAVNGVFGKWHSITNGESWQNSVVMAVVDSSGACSVCNYAGEIFTQLKSQTLVPGIQTLCDVGYNPNVGSGWYTEGEAGQFGLTVGTDGADPNDKYISYVSPRYDRISGRYIPGNDTVVPSPYYSWPLWDTSSTNIFERNYYFGDYISDVTMRNAASIESANPQLGFIGKMPKPAMVSQEDIVNLYSDEDTANNPGYLPNTGYPFGIDIQEVIYSWGYGRYRDMIFIRYKIKNSSNDTLFDSWIAPAFDPDLGFPDIEGELNDANSYVNDSVANAMSDSLSRSQMSEPYRSDPAKLNMAFQYNDPFKDLANGVQYGMVGFSFLESTVVDSLGNIIANDDSAALHGYGPNSIFQKNQQGLVTCRDWVVANDPVNGDLQYNFVSNGEHDTFNGVYGDQRLMMATGPFTLAPGKSAEATIVLTFARVSDTNYKQNFGALLLLTDFAHQVFGEVDSTQSGGSTDYFVNHFQVTPPSAVKSVEATSGLTIEQPYPNPFSTTCSIEYTNSIAGPASVIVTDVLGRTIRSYSLGDVAAGEHQLMIGDKDLPAGAYRVTVIVGDKSQTTSVVRTQ